MSIEFKPIGIIHARNKSVADIPRQRSVHNETGQVEIYPEFEAGLNDIEGFSHLIVLYVFDQSQGYKLTVQTPWDDQPHGVFASRSQNRPNPIGMNVVRLVSRDGRILNVMGLDALDGSPVLDLKPYIPDIDA